MTPKRPNPQAEARKAQEWNEANPIGTPVALRLDDGSSLLTKTKSEARKEIRHGKD